VGASPKIDTQALIFPTKKKGKSAVQKEVGTRGNKYKAIWKSCQKWGENALFKLWDRRGQ